MCSSRGQDKFIGSYGDLQAVIEATGERGFWIARGTHCTFRSKNRVVVRWCTTTKTIVFEGRYETAHKFRTLLSLLVGNNCEHRGTWGDDGDSSIGSSRWPRCFCPDPANDP